MATTKRTPQETWEAIEKQVREDEIDRFLAKSPAEVDASLRAAGHDPAAVRAEGAALAKKLLADRERLAWQVEAAEGLAREQARFDQRAPKHAGLSRMQLLERIAVARENPRLAQPVAVMFRNRKTEEASEDELRAILEEIEAIAESDDPAKRDDE
jgi:hypothetical protein